MKTSHLWRCLVCFALICCLMVNISPLRVHASVATSVFVSVAAGVAVGCLANAIGLMIGETGEAFNDIIGRCSTYLTEQGWIKDGKLGIGLFTDEDGVTRAYAPRGLIDVIRSWFWGDSGVISSSSNYVSAGVPYTFATGNVITPQGNYVGLRGNYVDNYGKNCFCEVVLFLSGSKYIASNGNTYSPSTSYWVGDQRYYYYGSSYSNAPDNIIALSQKSYGTITNGSASSMVMDYLLSDYFNGVFNSVSTSQDLTLGDIASPDTSLEEGYATWSTGAVSVPNADSGEDDVYYPVSIPSASTSVGTLTQTDAQAGSISQEMVDSLVGTDTEAGTGTATETVATTTWATFTEWFADKWADLKATVVAIPEAFAGWFQDVIAGLRAIPDVISTALTNAFAISDTYVVAKVEALALKYPYMETFNVLGADLKSFFSGLGTKPPQIYIHLGNSRGSYNWGGTMLFLDLSWYSEYKPMMDSVLGGFLWLWCGWRTYLALPGLLSGATGVWGAYRYEHERSLRIQQREARQRGKDEG